MSAASSANAMFDPEPFVRNYSRAITYVGLALTCVSVYMTWNFGYAWSGFDYAFALSIVSFFACTLPVVIVTVWVRGWKVFAYVMTGVWCITLSFDAVTQIGYTAATSKTERNNVQLTNLKWEGRKDAVEQHKIDRKIWLDQKEALLKLQPWAATVSADQLRAALVQLDENIADEGSAQAGGCGKKCRALKVQRQDMVQRIGAAEKLQNYNKQLRATDALLAKSKQVLDKTERKVSFGSAQMHQVSAVMSGFSLAPSPKFQKKTELIFLTLIGISITFLAAVANGLGLVNWGLIDRKREQEREALPAHVSDPIAWEQGDLPSFMKKDEAKGPSVIRFDLFDKHFSNLAARS